MAEQWRLQGAYDRRFGTLGLVVGRQGEQPVQFWMSLKAFLANLGVDPHELREFARQMEHPRLADVPADIEPARRKAIEDTHVYGKTVLDIGGYDGWAARLAWERGAARAICLDNQQYEHYGWKDKKLEGVEYITGDFMDYRSMYCADSDTIISKDRTVQLEKPDVIIFYNVLYHLKNPWRALDQLRTIVKPDGTMLLCTLFRYHDGPWVYLYEPRECNPDDETVYWGPSITALERLLKATGWDFEQVGLAMDRVVYRCTPTPGFERRHQDT